MGVAHTDITPVCYLFFLPFMEVGGRGGVCVVAACMLAATAAVVLSAECILSLLKNNVCMRMQDRKTL